MPTVDAAELPEASCAPEMVQDSLADVFRETFDRAIKAGALPPVFRNVCFRLIDEGMRSATESAGGEKSSKEILEAVTELLYLFANSPNPNLQAWCYLMNIDRCPYSEVEIAAKLNVTRAAVSKVKTEIQDRLQMQCRIGRTQESRDLFREIRLKAGKRKTKTWRQNPNSPTNLLRNALKNCALPSMVGAQA